MIVKSETNSLRTTEVALLHGCTCTALPLVIGRFQTWPSLQNVGRQLPG